MVIIGAKVRTYLRALAQIDQASIAILEAANAPGSDDSEGLVAAEAFAAEVAANIEALREEADLARSRPCGRLVVNALMELRHVATKGVTQ